jgi:hypothetical protein
MGYTECVSQNQPLILGYFLTKKGETEEWELSIPYTLSLFSGYNFSAKRSAQYRRLDRLRARGKNYAQ